MLEEVEVEELVEVEVRGADIFEWLIWMIVWVLVIGWGLKQDKKLLCGGCDWVGCGGEVMTCVLRLWMDTGMLV